MSRLFVANVSFKAEDADLRAVFERYGEVLECRIVFDRESRSRGFAFVTLERDEDARAVIDSKEPLVLFGRTLMIERAKER